MVKWGMITDLDKCVACQACTVSCLAENNQSIAGFTKEKALSELQSGRVMAWNDFITFTEGEYPNVSVVPMPRPCMHCDNPPCAKVCPVGARFKRESDGLVLTDFERCIGCRFCMVACPYGVNYFNWKKPEYVSERQLNPTGARFGTANVGPTPRPVGIVEKCTYCVQRIEKLKVDLVEGKAGYLSKKFASDLELVKAGKMSIDQVAAKAVDHIYKVLMEKSDEVIEIDNGEWKNWEGFEHFYVPACTSTCSPRARIFGDLDDKESIVAQMARSGRVMKLLEELGTEPKSFYLAQG